MNDPLVLPQQGDILAKEFFLRADWINYNKDGDLESNCLENATVHPSFCWELISSHPDHPDHLVKIEMSEDMAVHLQVLCENDLFHDALKDALTATFHLGLELGKLRIQDALRPRRDEV